MDRIGRQLVAGASAALLAGGTQSAHAKSATTASISPPRSRNARALAAYAKRVKSASQHLVATESLAAQPRNDDEVAHADYAGSFTKCLAHDELGRVQGSAYERLLAALETNDFSDVQLSTISDRKLANPSAAHAFEVHGKDAHATRIEAAPAMGGAHAAAEMIEVYWQALTRDVPYAAYESSSMIADAASDLDAATVAIGPREVGSTTAATIFRGQTSGDRAGPYISQLLWQPFRYGAGLVEQKYQPPMAGNDFMLLFDEYLAIQEGRAPRRGDALEAASRYIHSARDLANYVHSDVLFQAYYNAAMILLGLGSGARADNHSFSADLVEGGFVTFGGPDILNMVATAARLSLTGAWYQKWLHRKLRPEAMGARVEMQQRGLASFGLHDDLMASEAVHRTMQAQGNALLAQAFPEGSPTHPAYPAGHACVAGACATVLKAWFREDAVFPDPKISTADGSALVTYLGDELTIGGEINKLANNISIGRNAAGVHYRSDGEQGSIAGEQQALGLLEDYSVTYGERFDGFRLTRFDGTSVRIRNGTTRAMI